MIIWVPNIIMGFPVKKRAATNANDIHSDGDKRNGLDLLSAVIDSRIVQNNDETSFTSTVCSTASAISPAVVENIVHNDDGCDDSSISDQQSTFTTEKSMSPKAHHSFHKRVKTFPEVLMDILSNPENEHIVGWLQHGKSFAIHNPTLFSSQVLPKYFRRVIFRSFIRKLNRWGFRSTKRSVSGFASTFEHKYFRRDEPELCAKIYCKSNPTRRITAKKGGVDGGKPVHVVNGMNDDFVMTAASPNAKAASSPAVTHSALGQARPLLNTGSSLLRLPFLVEDFHAQISRATSVNHHLRMNCTTASANTSLPPSTRSVLSAAASQSVLSQAQQLLYMNNVRMLGPPAFTSGGNFPSSTHTDLSDELMFLQVQRQYQRRQQQQAIMSYFLSFQD